MSARAKKRLKTYSIITLIFAIGMLLYLFMRQTSSQENAGEGGNVSDSSDGTTLISSTTTEDENARNAWKREFIVEKEIEYYDEDIQETIRETVQSSIVEVGSGLNYLDGNEWKPANPQFVQTPTGFELVESCYKVKFGHRLTDVMTYESNGVSIPMQISSIVISDGTHQRTFTPAVNAVGAINTNNSSILHFTNALNNIDVTYRADKG